MGIIVCSLSLLCANLLAEYFGNQNYDQACFTAWEQLVAITIYYWLWVRPEEGERNVN